MHIEIQTALFNYRVDQNRERGWSMEAEKASYHALKTACENHGVDMRSVLFPPRPKITVTGPASVVHGAAADGAYVFEIFPRDAYIPHAVQSGRCCMSFPDKMDFHVTEGVSVVDHRQAA